MKRTALFVLLVALAVAVPAAAAKAPPYELYQAASGDTLQGVAERFGVTVEAICKLNQFSSDHALEAGESVAIPAERPSPPGAAEAGSAPAWVAVAAHNKALIRSQQGSGKILYRAAAGTPLVLAGEKGSYYAVLMIDGSTGWIAKKSVRFQPVAPVVSRAGSAQTSLLRMAFRYLGIPYKMGGTLPYSTDCSLFVQSVFAAFGMRLPRTAAEQFRAGQPVSPYDLQPGDRLYFATSKGRVNHTGIYVGNGMFIHASSNRGMVAIDSLSSDYYWRRFVGAMR